MDKIKICIPISEHEYKLLNDDKYYRECWTKDYEKMLVSLNVNDYNILVQLCFGSEDGNAWIDVSFWHKMGEVYSQIGLGEVLYGDGTVVIEYEGFTVDVEIIR